MKSSDIHSPVINYLATWPKICCTVNVYTLRVPQGLHNHLAYTIWSTSVAWPCLQNMLMMAHSCSILQCLQGNGNIKFSPGFDGVGEQSQHLLTKMCSTKIYVPMETYVNG